jgi:hypothetical protein
MDRDRVGLVAIAFFLLALAWIIVDAFAGHSSRISSFEECLEAGFPVAESYPRQCSTGETTFIEAVPDWHARPPECVIAGCSNELCIESAEAPYVVTTCMYHESYACYPIYSQCERQDTGLCGWTVKPELAACLENPRSFVPDLDRKEAI